MIIRKDSSFMYSTHHDCIWGGGKSELLNYVQLVHSNHNKEYNISFSLWHWCALHILNVYRTYVWMHWNMTSCILCITYEHIFKFILKIRFIIDCMYMHIRDRYAGYAVNSSFAFFTKRTTVLWSLKFPSLIIFHRFNCSIPFMFMAFALLKMSPVGKWKSPELRLLSLLFWKVKY